MTAAAKVTIYEALDRVLTKPMTDTQAAYAVDDLGLQIETAARLISDLERKAARRGKEQFDAARRGQSDAKALVRSLVRHVEHWRKLEDKWDALQQGEPTPDEVKDTERQLCQARNSVNEERVRLAQVLEHWKQADPRIGTQARIQGYINSLKMAGAWDWEADYGG